jgi:hypothetical protein
VVLVFWKLSKVKLGILFIESQSTSGIIFLRYLSLADDFLILMSFLINTDRCWRYRWNHWGKWEPCKFKGRKRIF